MMRHELLLAVMIILLLLVEIFRKGDGRSVRNFAIIMFAIALAIGFLPVPDGTLFGGMFRVSHTTVLMKNVLNIAVLIVMFQAHTWLGQEENQEKISEFFILLLSTLMGMDFMISSGHFLMFYLGLELATIPISALAAYDRYRNTSAEAGIKLILSSALSSGILLYGLSMIYGTTGSLYFDQVSQLFHGSTLGRTWLHLLLQRTRV